MPGSLVHLLPILPATAPAVRELARHFTFAPVTEREGVHFFPAVAGFDVGNGSQVDVSYLYSFTTDATPGVDRHLRTQEMFVPLDGDLCLPLAPSRRPQDRDDHPRPEDFVAVVVRHGEALILNANVWHNGGWPVDPHKGVRYIMVLSGHRAGAEGEEYLDFQTATLPGEAALLPDWRNR